MNFTDVDSSLTLGNFVAIILECGVVCFVTYSYIVILLVRRGGHTSNLKLVILVVCGTVDLEIAKEGVKKIF